MKMIEKLFLYFRRKKDNHLATFYHENFPGLDINDNVENLPPLLTSSDPDAFMKSKAIAETGELCSTPIPSSGVNFINILRTAFTHVDPELAKKESQFSIVILRFWALRA
jgi:hypothetical protein